MKIPRARINLRRRQTARASRPMPGLASREAALTALTAVFEQQRSLDPVLSGERWMALEARDRAFARLLTMTALRRTRALDAAVDGFLKDSRNIPLKVRNILRLAAAQLLYLETGAHAAVNAATELAGSESACRRYKGLVNAVARRLAAKAGDLRRQVEDISNTPPWLRDRWQRTYGEDTVRAIEAAHLAEPPLHLSVKSDPQTWAERLGGTVLPTGGVALTAGEVAGLPGFHDGEWWVQDAAAALPVRLLGDVRGREVYDLCAAPGGKTAQLAALGARATSLDLSPERLVRLRENLDRLRLDADLVTADLLTWEPGARAPRVLLDAPCTSTGTIRRHPDVAWTKTPADIVTLGMLQAEMLEQAARFVAPGGILVYCTCSLEPEEGPERIEALLEAHPEFARIPVTPEEIGGLAEALTPEGDLRTLPCHLAEWGGMDGFYAARLRRD